MFISTRGGKVDLSSQNGFFALITGEKASGEVGIEMLLIFILIFLILLIAVMAFAIVKVKGQNKRFSILAEISGEYIFEYNINRDSIILSDKCYELLRDVDSIIGDKESETKRTVFLPHSTINESFINTVACAPSGSEITITFRNGSSDVFRITSATDTKGNVIGKIENISLEKEERMKLLDKAARDGMTGLLNSESFKTTCSGILNSNEHYGEMGVVVLADIDNFKHINDTCGHITGDNAVRAVAKALSNLCRSTDIVGRVGGDEFCMFLYGSIKRDIIEKKMKQLSVLVSEDDSELKKLGITLSIGIARTIISRERQVTFLSLYRNADKALYHAKQSGKNRYIYYEDIEQDQED